MDKYVALGKRSQRHLTQNGSREKKRGHIQERLWEGSDDWVEYKNEWRVRLEDCIPGRGVSMWWEKVWCVQWTKSSLVLLGHKYMSGSCERWEWKGGGGPHCEEFCIWY